MVMLEWGSCGQIATAIPDERSDAEPACLGYVFYAPPRAVPRAHRFPSGPVSADAILLTSMGIEAGEDTDDLSHSLIAGVIDELVRRGVRAVEAFGRTTAAAELQDSNAVTPELQPVLAALGDCSVEHCMLDADFLIDVGFVVVGPHPYFLACASSWTRAWGGRPKSRPRWNGSWRMLNCSSRWEPALRVAVRK